MGVGEGGNVIVNGNLIVQNPRDVDQFVKEVQRKRHAARLETWDTSGCEPWARLMAVLAVFYWEGVSVAPAERSSRSRRPGHASTLSPTSAGLRRSRYAGAAPTSSSGQTPAPALSRSMTGTAASTRLPMTGFAAVCVRCPQPGNRHLAPPLPRPRRGARLRPAPLTGDGRGRDRGRGCALVFRRVRAAPGLAGDPIPDTPAGRDIAGNVFYEDDPVTGPQIRINQALADANWPSGLSSVFTGNVNLNETVYSPGESILAVIHDAADAEFPGVANFYVDRYGVVCFHGRNARFNPSSTASDATHWDFHVWDVGLGGTQIGPPFLVRRSSR